jgi:hypothetical protein
VEEEVGQEGLEARGVDADEGCPFMVEAELAKQPDVEDWGS